MSKLLKIDYFPKYINKITSFHFISQQELDNIKKLIDEEHFFIENFLRISKKNYEHVCKENLILQEVIDNQEILVIRNYLEYFSNDFDLLEMLNSNLNFDSDSVSSLSDEDLIDTINVIRIFESNLKDNDEKIKNIIEKNPHLLDDETVTECYNKTKVI